MIFPAWRPFFVSPLSTLQTNCTLPSATEARRTTPWPDLASTVSASSRRLSIESAWAAAAMTGMPSISSRLAKIASRLERAASFLSCCNSFSVSLSCPRRWPTFTATSSALTFNKAARLRITASSVLAFSRAAAPVTASMRRTPVPVPVSERIRKEPMTAVLVTWDPPHNSQLKSPTETTRTRFPYFSPNNAMAPFSFASCKAISSIVTGTFFNISSLTSASTFSSSSAETGEKFVKSKRRCSGVTSEPAWLTWFPRTFRSAAWSRCVAVWLRAIARFRALSTVISTASPVWIWPSATDAIRYTRPLGNALASVTRTDPSGAFNIPVSPSWPPPSAWNGLESRIIVTSSPSPACCTSTPSRPIMTICPFTASASFIRVSWSSFVVSGTATFADTFVRAARARSCCSFMAFLKPSMSSVYPFSAAISSVNSTGKPNVS